MKLEKDNFFRILNALEAQENRTIKKKKKETEITPHINLLIAARTSPTTNIQTAVCKQNKITGIKGQ